MRTKTLAAAVLALFLAGCSRSAPSIEYGTLRLVYYEEGSPRRIRERYSFFIIPQDGDGLEDLDTLYLYHDQEGLVWSLSSTDWIRLEEEGKTWIGSRSLSMGDGEELPRGQFRAVLADKGGERGERLFVFDAPARARFPFPSLRVEGDTWYIESRYPENQLLCYDAQGGFIDSIPVSPGPFQDLPPAARGAALWADDPEYQTAALTGIVSGEGQ